MLSFDIVPMILQILTVLVLGPLTGISTILQLVVVTFGIRAKPVCVAFAVLDFPPPSNIV